MGLKIWNHIFNINDSSKPLFGTTYFFAELVKLLESYMTKVNDGEGYTSWQCLACHKIFKRKHNCKEHIEAHHLKGAVEHKCSICPGTYSTEASYRQHMRNKH